jgi:mRNA degradation ribonuclease J1/J2
MKRKELGFLKEEFPGAVLGNDCGRPFARLANGEVYGLLFGEPGEPHAADPAWARGPIAIIKFTAEKVDSHNWEVYKFLPIPGQEALNEKN